MPAATELICYHISSSVIIMSLTLSCCCDQFNNNYTDDTLAVSLCLINGTGIVLFYTCLPICLPYREGFSKKKKHNSGPVHFSKIPTVHCREHLL